MEKENPLFDPSRFRRFKATLPFLLYAALIGYFYSFSQYGFNIWDEGGFANGTLRTLNGQQALKDFNPNGYLPGRYIYGAIFFKLLGIDIQSLRWSVILITPGMVFMVYAISRKIMPQGFAFLAALFMLSAPSMYYNRFFPFFTVLNLFCLLNVLEKKRMRDFLLLGASILLAGFFKFEIALIALLIALALTGVLILKKGSGNEALHLKSGDVPIPPPRLNLLSWISVVSLGLAFAATVGYFLQNGFFLKVFKLVVDAHNVWGNPFPDIFPLGPMIEKLGPHKMFERLLFYLPLWVYAGVGVILLSRIIKSKSAILTRDISLLIILSFGICVFGLVIWRAGFDNLLRTLPPFYILFCYLLYLGREKILCWMKVPGDSAQSDSFLEKIPVNVLIVSLPFLFFFEMNVHHGFYAGSIGAMKKETQWVQLDRLKVYTHPSEAKWLREVVDRIEIYTDKGDPILALPLNPIFYFLTDRVNPTRYDWILPGMLTTEEEKKMVEGLKIHRPKMVIFVDIPIDGKEERRLANYAPLLYGFLIENYQFDEIIGLFQILLPRQTKQTP
ncbi:MAG: glycosyltransferase family 39 protein [Nitrospinae bacterium]|nr:glycosyltransferase family 39 protein [Nitrospinota bacterium]